MLAKPHLAMQLKLQRTAAHTDLIPASCSPMEMVAIVVDAEAVLLPIHHQSTLPNAVGTATNGAALVGIL